MHLKQKPLINYFLILLLVFCTFLISARSVNAISGDTYPKQLRVLELQYFPAGNNYVYNPDTLSQNLQSMIENSSAYHKYQNANAISALDVNVLESTDIQGSRPSGNGDWEESVKQIITNNNLCQKIHDMDVDQVWIWADPRTGFDASPGPEYVVSSNRFRSAVQPVTIPSQPFCNGQDSFVVFEFDFSRTADLALHSYGHYMEGLIGNLLGGDVFWKQYSGDDSVQFSRSARCGNVHFPPNGRYDYDYSNTTRVNSYCESWNPQGTGTKKRFGCAEWGCTQEGYLKWWMQNMPSANNTLTYNSKKMPNWWDFQVDFDDQMNAYITNGTYYLNQTFIDANQPPLEAPAEIGEISTANQNSGTSISWDHTISGTNPLLLVSASYRAAINTTAHLTNVTYGGQPLTFIRRDNHNHRATEMWYMSNPPVGTAQVNGTWSADPEDQVFSATTVTNVNNANPIATQAGAGSDLWDNTQATNETITIASGANQVVIGALSTYPDGGANTATPKNDTAQIWLQRTSNNNIAGQGGAEAGAPSVTLEWHSGLNWSWAISAVSIRLNAPASVNNAVTTDKANYTIGIDSAAQINAVITDEAGNPITGLTNTAFTSQLDGNAASITFAETATLGTYSGSLDVSTLPLGNHTLNISATDSRALVGQGSTNFSMIQQQATQSIVDSITYALSGGKNNNRNIDITAHVKNNLGNAVAGAVVSLRVNKNGVLYQNINGTTLANGNATMQLSSAPTGCYTSVVQSVTAQGLTWDTVTPTNTICK
jgi:hypothetical protein